MSAPGLPADKKHRIVLLDNLIGGFHARVVQHEVDHLLGVLYPMRIRDLRQFGFIESLFPGQQVSDD